MQTALILANAYGVGLSDNLYRYTGKYESIISELGAKSHERWALQLKTDDKVLEKCSENFGTSFEFRNKKILFTWFLRIKHNVSYCYEIGINNRILGNADRIPAKLRN